ncbi:AAA family ATPase [Paenibacillus sp. J5C_2022]|uniref:AAA family ATPase n=1 Tax=Paenibacillus sp. J5C2022 TaxID=2977129 RepID=UPI0021CE3CB6|nr:AAA family ATPase [Paenibacillus sp. J5C2022]MCU6710627.1 AAA family ATPase [Paenibacillus sp. J5C2022]
MIIWINGAFGAGKTTSAYELHRRTPGTFLYDPENVGYFIRKNAPKPILLDDFQDHPEWREMNYSMLRMMANDYAGPIIVPMTIVNVVYFDEIIGKLRNEGIKVHHYALLATRETLLKRLKSRGEGSHSWAAAQIDRCLDSLSREKFGQHIVTDRLTTDEIIGQIAADTGLELEPDKRGKLKKKMDRLKVKVKHIRFFS